MCHFKQICSQQFFIRMNFFLKLNAIDLFVILVGIGLTVALKWYIQTKTAC